MNLDDWFFGGGVLKKVKSLKIFEDLYYSYWQLILHMHFDTFS